MPGPASFFALTPAEAEEAVVDLGGKAFHARVVRRSALEEGVLDYEAMTSLSKNLRERLARELPLLTSVEVARTKAPDKTTKVLLRYPDGGTVEAVHMPSYTKPGATLCVSTQIGCPVGCPFCASGKAGLDRNLEAHEILEQYLVGRSLGPLRRSVVMGIGEPLLNADNLLTALTVVNGEMGLGARKITVSTIGYPERVRRMAARKPPFQLAISLHTPDDDQRDVLVPAMAGTPIDEILAAGDHWFATTGREVTYEYVLLRGENDTEGHARRLAQRLSGRRATVNLIPYNPIGDADYGRPEPRDANRFQELLQAAGLVATVRWSRGVDTDAACGQLRIRERAS